MAEERIGLAVSDKSEVVSLLLLIRENIGKRICSNCKTDMNLLPPDDSLFIKFDCPKCKASHWEFVQFTKDAEGKIRRELEKRELKERQCSNCGYGCSDGPQIEIDRAGETGLSITLNCPKCSKKTTEILPLKSEGGEKE